MCFLLIYLKMNFKSKRVHLLCSLPLRGSDDNQIWEAPSQTEERGVISKRARGAQEFVIETEKRPVYRLLQEKGRMTRLSCPL